MRINDKYILFWNGMMSNWAHAPYWWGGCHFENSEQHYMWLKAMHFGDEAMAKKILRETNPKITKSLGRKVSGYDDDEWAKHRENAMFHACYAKFTRNKKAHDFMMGLPRDKQFAEASPFDIIWGIGYEEHNPNAQDESTWRGQNLLGKVLTDVRSKILEQSKTLFDI